MLLAWQAPRLLAPMPPARWLVLLARQAVWLVAVWLALLAARWSVLLLLVLVQQLPALVLPALLSRRQAVPLLLAVLGPLQPARWQVLLALLARQAVWLVPVLLALLTARRPMLVLLVLVQVLPAPVLPKLLARRQVLPVLPALLSPVPQVLLVLVPLLVPLGMRRNWLHPRRRRMARAQLQHQVDIAVLACIRMLDGI